MSDELERLRQENERLSRENAKFKRLIIQSIRSGGRGFVDWEDDVPNEWKQESEVVAAAIQGGQIVWRNVKETFRLDPVVILAALEKLDERSALRYGDDSFLQWMGDTIKWTDIPENLRRNHMEIALHGVKNNRINPDDCPCLLDQGLMMDQFLENDEIKWQHLPTTLRNNIEVARSIEKFPSLAKACELFAHFPLLRQDRIFWLKVVDVPDFVYYWEFIFRDFAAAEIRADEEVMLNACARCEDILPSVDQRLAANHDFLLALAGRNASMLLHLSRELQLRFPDVVDRALQFSAFRKWNLVSWSPRSVEGCVHFDPRALGRPRLCAALVSPWFSFRGPWHIPTTGMEGR